MTGRARWALLTVAVVVSATVVVTTFNPAPHTGGDNAGYVTLGYSLLRHHTYTELFDPAAPPHTKYPPVFPALLALAMALGARTWTALKVVASLSTVATVGLTWLWAERRLGPVWALGVALVTAMATSVAYYGHWILSDPTFLAFTLLALYALERAGEEDARPGWLIVGVAATALAYFTRSAGLPLVVALGAWLALRRRWRSLAVSAVALGLPMTWWLLRARGAGQGEYGSEFWLVDPYQPGLGRVGLGGLVGRVWANLVAYVGTHLPGGIVGTHGTLVAALGIALVLLGLVGWGYALRRRLGTAELFLPLYAGLILLWPVVWSGDRFALPLYPLLFVYAASVLEKGTGRFGPAAPRVAGAIALLVVMLPEMKSWATAAGEASACAAVVRAQGPFACYGPRITSFVDAAAWSGANLPPGSAVLSRKPRMFYVLSGVPSRTFPFDDAVATHLSLAASVGARYELLDVWDGLARRYVAGAVRQAPGAWCAVGSFGEGTQLLGILPPGQRVLDAPPADAEGGVRIDRCPASYVAGDGSAPYSSSATTIPLLRDLGSVP